MRKVILSGAVACLAACHTMPQPGDKAGPTLTVLANGVTVIRTNAIEANPCPRGTRLSPRWAGAEPPIPAFPNTPLQVLASDESGIQRIAVAFPPDGSVLPHHIAEGAAFDDRTHILARDFAAPFSTLQNLQFQAYMVPTSVAEGYVLTVEMTDSAGNRATRTLTFRVQQQVCI